MNDTEKRERVHFLSDSSAPMKQTLGDSEQTEDDRRTAVEKRGPYIMSKAPTLHMKLQKQRDAARTSLEKRGFSSDRPVLQQPRHKLKTMMFNKGYTALSQTGEDYLITLDSDSETELDCSSGYSSAECRSCIGTGLDLHGLVGGASWAAAGGLSLFFVVVCSVAFGRAH
ncbi:protein FAM219B isoform X3 [Triplophysa dalaica]|uniref:protein FAM219B isoform X3 n=1 Tax=Triplophysa dalaica TaxID=1582913 RepID=UPI0024DFEA45|nr:protein FAM219B isoform X3 [Triplophysa dalaica]